MRDVIHFAAICAVMLFEFWLGYYMGRQRERARVRAAIVALRAAADARATLDALETLGFRYEWHYRASHGPDDA
jgi:hypothetical protein